MVQPHPQQLIPQLQQPFQQMQGSNTGMPPMPNGGGSSNNQPGAPNNNIVAQVRRALSQMSLVERQEFVQHLFNTISNTSLDGIVNQFSNNNPPNTNNLATGMPSPTPNSGPPKQQGGGRGFQSSAQFPNGNRLNQQGSQWSPSNQSDSSDVDPNLSSPASESEWDILTGTSNQDNFELEVDNPVIINNFQDGQDLMILDNLTFEDLTIEPISGGIVNPDGSSDPATVIKLDGDVLAQLNGIDSSLITADDFTFL